jgi:hypothetical protein
VKGRGFLAGMLVAALLLGGAVYTAVANPLAQTSSEPEGLAVVGAAAGLDLGSAPDTDGYTGPLLEAQQGPVTPSDEAPGLAGAIAGFTMGDAPDTDGYTGPPPEAQGPLFPSEAGLMEEMPDWESFFLEPQPDEDGYAAAGALEALEWSDFYYVFVAGSTFRPRASSTTWAYPGVGCINAASGNEIFTSPLHLPQGSRIDYVRLYYRDTSANDSSAWLTSYSAAGAFADVTTVSSVGSSGYGSNLSPLVEHVVNNASLSYTLNWRANQTGSSMQLCGMRVAYRLP